jgi:hypothetical protein
MIISHSLSIYPSVLLCEDKSGPEVKSIAFFNPPGHRRPKVFRPVWYVEGIVRVYQNKLSRDIFNSIYGTLSNMGKIVPSNAGKVQLAPINENSILSATTLAYSGHQRVI